MTAKKLAQIVVLDSPDEMEYVRRVVTDAVRDPVPLFLGRFLTDMDMEWIAPRLDASPWILLRQYGGSCFVNAPPLLADALRAETGVGEAEAVLRKGMHRTVVLSQILEAVEEELLEPRDIVSLLDACPAHVSLILTGCSPSSRLTGSPELIRRVAVQTELTY